MRRTTPQTPAHGIRGYGSKAELLRRQVAGRNVVHLGAVGATCLSVAEKVAASRSSVHAQLSSQAAACVGVDIDGAAIAALRSAGVFNNLIEADATRITRTEIALPSIDVVVAGDIIEHLGRPADLLEGIRSWCDEQTTLVVTTPNSVGLPQFLRYAAGRDIEGPDHVCAFNIYTLRRLLERHGWQVVESWTCYQRLAETRRGFAIGRAVLAALPRLGGTLLFVARPR